jgi:hypothetical protein
MMMLLPTPTSTPCSPPFSSPSHRNLPSVVAASDRADDAGGLVTSHEVHPHDVLLTHQAELPSSKKQAGNYHYTMLVRENLDRHRQLSAVPRHQQLLCRSLVLAVRAQDPPGRFLVPSSQQPLDDDDAENVPSLWVSVDDAIATEATGRMFAEEQAANSKAMS